MSAHDCRPRRPPLHARTVGRRRYADDASRVTLRKCRSRVPEPGKIVLRAPVVLGDNHDRSFQILVQFWNSMPRHLTSVVPVNDMLHGMTVDTEPQDGHTIWASSHELLQIRIGRSWIRSDWQGRLNWWQRAKAG